MRSLILPVLCILAMAGCTAAQTERAAATEQLFCRIATAYGPVVAGVADAADRKPVIVTDKTVAAVAAICKEAGGIQTPAPVNPASVPIVVVNVPTVDVQPKR